VPSYEGDIPPTIMGIPVVKPMTYKKASLRLKYVYELLETIARQRTQWFFTGAGRDRFNRTTPEKDDFWMDIDFYYYGWRYEHFMGLIDSDNQPKKEVVTALMELIIQ